MIVCLNISMLSKKIEETVLYEYRGGYEMEKVNKDCIPFMGFPMRKPEMQIETPAPNPFQPVAEESDFSRDTQTWD